MTVVPSYPDPVFHDEDINGMWWFWDETWANRHGPFETEDDARRALDAYVYYLENGVFNDRTVQS